MGGFTVVKWLTRKQPRAIMYHRFSDVPQDGKVPAAAFDRQMEELKSSFNVMHMAQAREELRRHNALPNNTVVLTIDDGYRDFYQIAYPILKKHSLPATVYITTGFIDRKTWLWPDIISYIIAHSPNETIGLDSRHSSIQLPVNTEEAKTKAWDKLVALCLSVGDLERRELINQLMEDSNVNMPDEPVAEYEPMTWDEIRDLSGNGIDIGAHTVSHPVLSKVNPADLEKEILGAKTRIEKEIGKDVNSFCYPNGQPGDLNDRVKAAVIKAGYTSAVAAFYDSQGWSDLYQIRRYSANSSMYHFKKVIYGSQLLASKFESVKH